MSEGEAGTPDAPPETRATDLPSIEIGAQTVIELSFFIIVMNIYTLAFGFGVATIVFFIIAPSGAAALAAVSTSIGILGTMMIFIRNFVIGIMERLLD